MSEDSPNLLGSQVGTHSVVISMQERQRALSIARRLGTEIPGNINAVMWALPIIEILLLRLEVLENKLERNGIK